VWCSGITSRAINTILWTCDWVWQTDSNPSVFGIVVEAAFELLHSKSKYFHMNISEISITIVMVDLAPPKRTHAFGVDSIFPWQFESLCDRFAKWMEYRSIWLRHESPASALAWVFMPYFSFRIPRSNNLHRMPISEYPGCLCDCPNECQLFLFFTNTWNCEYQWVIVLCSIFVCAQFDLNSLVMHAHVKWAVLS
jgi:hypothetical protein